MIAPGHASKRTLARAKSIARYGMPELRALVERGELPLKIADELLRLPKSDIRKAVEQGAAACRNAVQRAQALRTWRLLRDKVLLAIHEHTTRTNPGASARASLDGSLAKQHREQVALADAIATALVRRGRP